MAPTTQLSPHPTHATPVPSVRPRRYYTAAEVAQDFVGLTRSHFYRPGVRERLHTKEKLPRPYCQRPLRFDRSMMDAWKLGRMVPVAANDCEISLADRRDRLAGEYSHRAGAD